MTQRPAQTLTIRSILFPLTMALLAGALISGCATTGPDATSAGYEHQQGTSHVRLAPIEPDAPPNNHPYQIDAGSLQPWLSGLQVTGNINIRGEAEVFSEDEVALLAEHISIALAKASPNQDVVFQSADARGIFGKFSRRSYTSGRVFVQQERLNIIFGVMHSDVDTDEQYRIDKVSFPTGSRSRRAESGWEVAGTTGTAMTNRGDWISFAAVADTMAKPMAPPTMAAPSPASPGIDTAAPTTMDNTVEQQSQQIESRLRVLDDLKAKGLITDEEYQARRKTILDGI